MSRLSHQLNEEESLSQSSDEKMDTGSGSVRSLDTPNSDFDERMDTSVLRILRPKENTTERTSANRTVNIDPNSNKNKTNLVQTTFHPLMLTSSNDYLAKEQNERDLISSLEHKHNENGYALYNHDSNNSKNNLFISDACTTAETTDVPSIVVINASDSLTISENTMYGNSDSSPEFHVRTPPPLKLRLRYPDTPEQQNTPPIAASATHAVLNRNANSTPNIYGQNSRVLWWSHSPITSNCYVPKEVYMNMISRKKLAYPDTLSSSPQNERSFETMLDPATGSVILRPAQSPQCSPVTQRRKIMVPPDDDTCSQDSSSIESDEELPENQAVKQENQLNETVLEDAKSFRSLSLNMCSVDSFSISEYSAAEEYNNERSFVSVKTGDTSALLDMKVVEPFKRVLSHGGYDANGSAIIVVSACFLPDKHRPDYHYVMKQLFLYVIWSLERLISEEYVLIYLHGSGASRQLPSIHWLHECYLLIDHRIRKNIKKLFIVHPTFWLKSIVILAKLFLSKKFYYKLNYVSNLEKLYRLVPVQTHAIPDQVKDYDQGRK